jgi:hypothetical protein
MNSGHPVRSGAIQARRPLSDAEGQAVFRVAREKDREALSWIDIAVIDMEKANDEEKELVRLVESTRDAINKLIGADEQRPSDLR